MSAIIDGSINNYIISQINTSGTSAGSSAYMLPTVASGSAYIPGAGPTGPYWPTGTWTVSPTGPYSPQGSPGNLCATGPADPFISISFVIKDVEKIQIKSDKDGCSCKKCKNFFQFAEPNQEDKTFVCFSCRSGW